MDSSTEQFQSPGGPLWMDQTRSCFGRCVWSSSRRAGPERHLGLTRSDNLATLPHSATGPAQEHESRSFPIRLWDLIGFDRPTLPLENYPGKHTFFSERSLPSGSQFLL
ncbi:hypothetical protein J6590_017092 [Homalodisca vitripennis]|nr:hypothetical protein J6590_017092 [Homalodisca vitripennis]